MKGIVLLNLLFLLGSCKLSHESKEELDRLTKEIQGNWVSEKDTNWKISFVRDSYIDIYDNDTLGVNKFLISKASCDFKYFNTDLQHDSTLLFLNIYSLKQNNTICNVLYGMSKDYLSFGWTENGKPLVFRRLKQHAK